LIVANYQKRRGLAGQTHPFTTRAFQWPLNLGIQQPYWQAGGPSGFQDGTAGAIQPYPYLTGFKNFIAAFPYGVASTLVTASGKSVNLGTAARGFLPIGMIKPQTYTAVSF
jgi:hypothetical protein